MLANNRRLLDARLGAGTRNTFSGCGGQNADRVATVFDILHPDSSMSETRRNHVRDAMHIATAIRYGLNGFITRDTAILGKQAKIKERFDGFLVRDPSGALTISRRFVGRAGISQQMNKDAEE